MSIFRVHDLWGIITGMLVLIALYLIVKNSNGARTVLGTIFAGAGNLTKDLQGRN
jgi:hypothetical protein